MPRPGLAILFAVLLAGCGKPTDKVRASLERGDPVIELPDELHLNRPLCHSEGFPKYSAARGSTDGATIVLDPGFQGSAAIEADGVSGLTLSGFTIAGNRSEMKSPWSLPLKEAAFADYYTNNGIVVRNSTNIAIRGVTFERIRLRSPVLS